MSMNYRSIGAGLVLLVCLVGGVLFFKSHRPFPISKTQVPPLPSGTPIYEAKLKIKGPDTAPVKLVEYSDFQCPSCRGVEPVLTEFSKKYPDKIQLTYKHFPLHSHQWALLAHQAAECMNAQGKFWEYHDILYEKQPEWAASQTPPTEFLLKYAQELKADMNQMSACLSDVAVTRAIFVEKDEGNAQQVGATPTFFLGKQRFVGSKGLKEEGENAIRAVLGLGPIDIPKTPDPAKAAPSAQKS